ncbi:MASE1 domain-containing protein [Xanthomonas euvesicatoria]|uniref:MASE1 domain-containing protein n=1 Tax=Xanthomonas euvesicatoria TaxID=456327 RepID=UPI001C43AD6C|nr:MASE1 domain-containing protein [Xanthomonas euvesicatoria]MBV6776895.1 MASE1 domain-containing protein [Xanthomonas campestris pv. carissae]
MDGWKKINAAQGLLTAILYCCSFYIAWHASFDQWYLPAGLRIAALLCLPRRLLPWMLLADVSSLLILRVPAIKALGVDPVWAYCSPWVLTTLIAAVPLAIRARLKRRRLETWLVPALLATAVWGAACTIGVNIVLDGPASTC